MKLVVNGETREMPEGASVVGLLRELKLHTQACAVEVNKQLVPKARHEEQKLSEGDQVEVVTLVGGG